MGPSKAILLRRGRPVVGPDSRLFAGAQPRRPKRRSSSASPMVRTVGRPWGQA